MGPTDLENPLDASDLGEIGLIRRASPLVDAFDGRLPLQRELEDISEHFGREIAQTVFTQSLERSKIYSGLIRRIRSFDARSFAHLREKAAAFEVTIVRSTLPVRGIEWGVFAETWQTWARTLGFTTDIIETREENDIRANARLISTHLISNPHPRRILVTYGQGSAEFRSLLTSRMGLRGDLDRASGTGSAASTAAGETLLSFDGAELSAIHSWINIAGAVCGAAIARLENDSRLNSFVVGLSRYFDPFSMQSRARRVRQLDPRLPAWRARPNYTPRLQVVNVIGLPYATEMPRNLLVSHERLLRKMGPNDGAVGLYDAIAHPGLIVPVVGMTHNAESIKIEPVLKRILAIIATDAEVETPNLRSTDEPATGKFGGTDVGQAGALLSAKQEETGGETFTVGSSRHDLTLMHESDFHVETLHSPENPDGSRLEIEAGL